MPVPVLNQTEALPAVVGLSSSEGESSSFDGRGSVFGSPPLLVSVALDVPPAPVKPLAVLARGRDLGFVSAIRISHFTVSLS
jgi:hypothetical protein